MSATALITVASELKIRRPRLELIESGLANVSRGVSIAVIQTFMYPNAYNEHLAWGAILVLLLTRTRSLLRRSSDRSICEERIPPLTRTRREFSAIRSRQMVRWFVLLIRSALRPN
jgi:hypothetical protein